MIEHNIDTLYVCGCSFTRMCSKIKDGVQHPDVSDQWPQLLANKLKIPNVVNDALWNGNNARTFRKLEEFLRTTDVDPEKIFVIIQFTFPWRFEMWTDMEHDDYSWSESPIRENWARLNPGWAKIEEPFQADAHDWSVAINPPKKDDPDHDKIKQLIYQGRIKAYGKAVDWNPETEYQTLMRDCLAIDNILNLYNVKRRYCFGDEANSKVTKRLIKLVPGFLKNLVFMNVIPNELKTIDNYHADALGNIHLADLLYDELHDNLTEKTVQNYQ